MIEVLVILEIEGLENQEVLEKHVKKEGFLVVENEQLRLYRTEFNHNLCNKGLYSRGV